jgi:predicted Ser/Thr protein kinase
MALYYEKNILNPKVFERLLINPEQYTSTFTKKDDIQRIVDFEKKWSEKVHTLAKKHGYQLHLDQPYFLGFGTTATVYKVYRGSGAYALKFFYKPESAEHYSIETKGYDTITSSSTSLDPYILKYYVSYFDPKQSVGLVIMDHVGLTLAKYMDTNPPAPAVEKVCKQLVKLEEAMENAEIYHNDLHAQNIMVRLTRKQEPRIFIIDYGQISLEPNENFGSFCSTLKTFCGKECMHPQLGKYRSKNRSRYLWVMVALVLILLFLLWRKN